MSVQSVRKFALSVAASVSIFTGSTLTVSGLTAGTAFAASADGATDSAVAIRASAERQLHWMDNAIRQQMQKIATMPEGPDRDVAMLKLRNLTQQRQQVISSAQTALQAMHAPSQIGR